MTDNRTTELLRKLLDERGVKWWPMRNNGYYEDRDTEFVANGKKHTAHEWGDGLAVYNLTPEQAIAATLGSGTCHIVKTWSDSDYNEDWRYRCSECGCNIPVNERDPETGDVINAANYCPNCGRKVIPCDHS